MNTLKIFWQNREIRNKILITIFILVIFRFLSAIPIPAIQKSDLTSIFSGNDTLNILSMLSGGSFGTSSIMAIGLGPYISASYIFQLLSLISSKVKELQEGGAAERKQLNIYTRFLTVPLALLQSFAIYNWLTLTKLIENPDRLTIVSVMVLLTFGAIVAMWLGELVAEYGIGNGASLIIMAGILVTLPHSLKIAYDKLVDPIDYAIVTIILVSMLVVSAIMFLAERKIPIRYARSIYSKKSEVKNFLPIKLNPAGVMPVIFAYSLVQFPVLMVEIATKQSKFDWLTNYGKDIQPFVTNPTTQNMALLVSVVFFSFFSAFIIFRPKEVSENLNKQTAFIPGIRPGKSTEDFLTKKLLEVVIVGAVFLTLITALPPIILEWRNLPNLQVSGTGILIIVGVMIDLVQRLKSMQVIEPVKGKYY